MCKCTCLCMSQGPVNSTDLWPVRAWVSCKAPRCCWTSARRCWRCAGWCCWSSLCWPNQPEPRQRSRSSYSLQRHRTQHTELSHCSPYSQLHITLNRKTPDSWSVFIGINGGARCGSDIFKNKQKKNRTALYNDRKLTQVPDVGQSHLWPNQSTLKRHPDDKMYFGSCMNVLLSFLKLDVGQLLSQLNFLLYSERYGGCHAELKTTNETISSSVLWGA